MRRAALIPGASISDVQGEAVCREFDFTPAG
jgi:hypothetical protein